MKKVLSVLLILTVLFTLACCNSASEQLQKPSEKESISVGKLSPQHEFYNEVVEFDPDCKDYITEIHMYDEQIDDYFVIHLSLPPNYKEGEKYPLVVMTDGVWRLSDHPEFRVLMENGEIEPVIFASVGYPNGYEYTEIRERDLVHQPENFLNFIVDDLVPYILENYPASEEDMTLVGHSYGGFWGFYSLFHCDEKGKDIFTNYFIGSPSLFAITDGEQIDDFEASYYERHKELSKNVYVSVGSLEPQDFIQTINWFIDKLQERDYNGLTLKYEIIEGFDHNHVYKPSFKNALYMFYGTDK